MPKRTLKEIAKSLGVSSATVSMAMRDSPKISQATKDRVLAAVKESGYVYQRAAAGLRTARTHTVGVVLNNISDPFYVSLLAQLEEKFSEAGLTMFLCNTNESIERQNVFLRTMSEYNTDGIVLCPAIGTELSDVEELSNILPPVVCISRHLPGTPFDYVVNDDVDASQIAVRHLASLGHQRIVSVGGEEQSSTFQACLRGYRAGLEESGIRFRKNYVHRCVPVRSGGVTAADWIASLDPMPTGAVCYNDVIALGLNAGLRRHGIKVGENFSIVGHENIEESALSSPPLTVTSVAKEEMGRQASNLLIERMAQPDLPARSIVLGSTLVVRESCHRVEEQG